MHALGSRLGTSQACSLQREPCHSWHGCSAVAGFSWTGVHCMQQLHMQAEPETSQRCSCVSMIRPPCAGLPMAHQPEGTASGAGSDAAAGPTHPQQQQQQEEEEQLEAWSGLCGSTSEDTELDALLAGFLPPPARPRATRRATARPQPCTLGSRVPQSGGAAAGSWPRLMACWLVEGGKLGAGPLTDMQIWHAAALRAPAAGARPARLPRQRRRAGSSPGPGPRTSFPAQAVRRTGCSS